MKKYDLFPGTVVGFYWWLVKKFRYYVFGLLFLLPLQNILGRIAPALVVRWVLDGITGADPNLPLMPQMTPVLLLVTATFLIVLIAEAASGYVESKYDPIVKVKVGEIVYRRLARQTVAFFKDHAAGFLVEQAGFIINRFRKIVVSHTYGLIALMGVLIVNSALMFQVHWAVAVLFMVCAGVRFGHCGLHTKGLWTAWVAAARYSAKVTASYVDSVSNFMNIKLFARRDAEARYLNKVRGEHARLRQIANFRELWFWIPPYTVEQLCHAGLLALLVYLYGQGTITIGDITFTYMAFATMMSVVRDMTWKIPDIADDLSTVAQAYRDIAKPIGISDAPHAKCLDSETCEICFDDVSFKYRDEDDTVIRNMSLCVRPGEKVGIVGLSGSGKSTLLYLLMRLYDVAKGKITINGVDVRAVTQESLKAAISFVPQDSVLFNRTLAENISYGKPSAKRKDIVRAAKLASAHEFILKMEKGYDTMVGDRGVKLSGGQRQRVAIARTICKDAPIVVMDEATSALDSKTESVIQRGMKKILNGRTALVVAHRLSTLKQMDRIIVLDKGKIAEEGHHADLIAKGGIYAKLWSLQEGGFIK